MTLKKFLNPNFAMKMIHQKNLNTIWTHKNN